MEPTLADLAAVIQRAEVVGAPHGGVERHGHEPLDELVSGVARAVHDIDGVVEVDEDEVDAGRERLGVVPREARPRPAVDVGQEPLKPDLGSAPPFGLGGGRLSHGPRFR